MTASCWTLKPHGCRAADDPNRAAIAKAKLPKSVTHVRTRTKIPHNKFIVKLVGGAPVQVWTGSTNFTDTGFFGPEDNAASHYYGASQRVTRS